MDLEKNKQRLEILAAEVEELKNGGGGGATDSYTKAEADNKFAEKTNVYTKTEADNKFVEKGTPVETDLTPVNIGNKVDTFPEEYRYLLQKHLPFKFTASYPYGSTWNGSWSVVAEDSNNYYCASLGQDNSYTATFHFAQFKVNKSTWAWSSIAPNKLGLILVSGQSDQFFYGNTNIQSITTNYNLNSLSFGRYYCTADNAATLTNCPTTDAFQLLAYRAAPSGNSEEIQQLTTLTANPIVYRRTKINNAWNSWYKFEGSVVS